MYKPKSWDSPDIMGSSQSYGLASIQHVSCQTIHPFMPHAWGVMDGIIILEVGIVL